MKELSKKEFWEMVDSNQIKLLPNDQVKANGYVYNIKTVGKKVIFEEV